MPTKAGAAKTHAQNGGSRPAPSKLASLSDEQLVEHVARRSEWALAELSRRHRSGAHRLALRVVADPGLAEDAVQEGFIALWSSAGRFAPGRSRARTWIYMLVHRRAVDLVRREERLRVQSLGHAYHTRREEGIHDRASTRLDLTHLRESLQALSHDQRQALALAYYAGYSQAEVASRLDQPLGTIKSRMFSGLKRLRKLLPQELADNPVTAATTTSYRE